MQVAVNPVIDLGYDLVKSQLLVYFAVFGTELFSLWNT